MKAIRFIQKHPSLFIFLLFMLTRFLFKWISGYDNFELFGDSYRYDILSDRILSGDYDLDYTAYIIAPLLPYYLALMKILFGIHWQFWGMFFQFVVIAASGICLYKLALLLFRSEVVAWLAALFYCFFPITLWYNFTFTQETLFQGFFIISIYYLVKTLDDNQIKYLIISAVFFSLAFLTKSHGLLFAPFIVVLFFLNQQLSFLNKIKYSFFYGAICLLFTVPNGLYNLKKHGVYTFSSYGSATFFYYGHCEYTYITHFYPTYKDITEGADASFIFDKDFNHPGYGKINALPHKEKAKWYTKMAFDWMRQNPYKCLQIEAFSFYRFFMPGVSMHHYLFYKWLLSFIFSLPIYLLAYFGIWTAVRQSPRQHLWILFLMLMMLGFNLVFSPQSRFRTVTLEPFYTMYAAFAFMFLYNKYSSLLLKSVKK